MIEEICDVWDKYDQGNWIAITTNYGWKLDGKNPMGAGVARQAAKRFPELPKWYGKKCQERAKRYSIPLMPVILNTGLRLAMFPTKELNVRFPHLSWQSDSSFRQIIFSVDSLLRKIYILRNSQVYLPRPGCSNGGLQWQQVKPHLVSLPDQIVVVSNHA